MAPGIFNILMPKEYLGDSVYAEFDGFSIVLTTENGMGPSNTIVLEPQVLRALDSFRAELAKRYVCPRLAPNS